MGSAMLAVAMNITLGQIVRDLQVVIRERVVLLGVEHLEQRRARVTAEVVADLVHLVHHEDGVDGGWPSSCPG